MRENLTSGSMWQGMETRLKNPRRHSLTLPLDDVDTLPFAGIFLASSFFCSRTMFTPALPPVPQTVGRILWSKVVCRN